MLPSGLVDVPAIEVARLLALDELADRDAPEVLAFARAIERRALGGVWQMSTSGSSPENLLSRSVNSCSLYSPGVLKGVGFE